MKLVVDEWLWADASGDNGQERQKDSLRFLEAVFQRCDKIVIPKGTPFVHKFHELCKRAGSNHPARPIVRYFAVKFFWNSEKGELLELPTNRPEQANPKDHVKPDDHYLVLTLEHSQANLLVTTDEPLIATLRKRGLRVVPRDEFLPNYICGA
jgi:hypothetical protein